MAHGGGGAGVFGWTHGNLLADRKEADGLEVDIC